MIITKIKQIYHNYQSNRNNKSTNITAHKLFFVIAEQSRASHLYEEQACGCADSIEGRADMVILHLAMVFHLFDKIALNDNADIVRIKKMQQAMMEVAMSYFDIGLRDANIGDAKIGRHVKKLAKRSYGHFEVYKKHFENINSYKEDEQDSIKQAININLLGDGTHQNINPDNLNSYIMSKLEYLYNNNSEDSIFNDEKIDFG